MTHRIEWTCDRCQATGVVVIRDGTPDAAVWSVVQTITANHDADARAWQAHCVFDAALVHVRIPTNP